MTGRRFGRRLSVAVAAVLAVGGPAACSSQRSTVPAASTKPCDGVLAPDPAPADLGLDADGVRAPSWSGLDGAIEGAAGGLLFASTPDDCLAALRADSGVQAWSRQPPWGEPVLGLSAAANLVLAATGRPFRPGSGQGAAAAAIATVDRLSGLDPRTGRLRWTLRLLSSDPDLMPAAIFADRVVVSEPNGAVLGLDSLTGARRWSDPPPHGCAGTGPAASDGPATAAVLSRGPAATLVYRRSGGQRVTRLDPATGHTMWTLALPDALTVQDQSSTGSSTGVLGLVVAGRGAPLAAVRTARPPGPRGYGGDTALAVDAVTGTPLWQVSGVPPSAVLVGGAGSLCAVSGFGQAC